MGYTALQKFLEDNNALQLSDEQLFKLMLTKKVSVSFEPGLVLFKYNMDANFTDPVVCNCRGIILYRDNFDIACYPFDKFNNFNFYVDDIIDWSTAVVEEKLDGSLIKVWYDLLHEKWVISTNGTIYATKAVNYDNRTFNDMFFSANNQLDFNKLYIDNTYMFELTSNHNRIVVPYDDTEIWHIGTRNNQIGQEIQVDIGIQKPKIYDLKSLDDCLQLVYTFDLKHEGLVVRDANYNRIKIKSPLYLKSHYVMSYVKTANPEKLISLLHYVESIDYADLPNDVSTYLKALRASLMRARLSLISILQYYEIHSKEFTTRQELFEDVKKNTVQPIYIKYIMRGIGSNIDEYVRSIPDEQILKMDPDIVSELHNKFV